MGRLLLFYPHYMTIMLSLYSLRLAMKSSCWKHGTAAACVCVCEWVVFQFCLACLAKAMSNGFLTFSPIVVKSNKVTDSSMLSHLWRLVAVLHNGWPRFALLPIMMTVFRSHHRVSFELHGSKGMNICSPQIISILQNLGPRPSLFSTFI